jgi:hypothetical protein
LESGGTVVLFPGDMTSVGDYSVIDFLPAKPISLRTLEAGRFPTKLVDLTHPLFANAWDGETPFPALPQQKLLDWKLGPEAKPLITLTGTNGAMPFLIAAEHHAGRVFIVNASADRTWGDFPLSPAFLPLVQQITRLSAAQAGRQARFTVGDTIPLPPALPKDQPIKITAPDGSIRQLPAGPKDALIPRAEQPGIYEAQAGDQTAMFAVNVDPAESNLHATDPAVLQKLIPHDDLLGIDALKQWLAKSQGVVPLWPLALALALAVFAAESLLSNVMAGRRAQGENHQIKTGRLNRRRAGTPFRAGVGESEEEVRL